MNANYYGYPKDKMWYAVQFNIVNPTNSPFTIDLFNGYNQVPIQANPSPITNPTIISGNISVGTQPVGIVYNPNNNFIYVANSGSNNISVIDSSTDSLYSTISVGTTPVEMAINSLNNAIYVVNQGSNNVYIIDCNTNSVIGSPISIALGGNGIAYCTSNNKMYICNVPSGNIQVLDCSSNTIINTISTGANVIGIVYNSTNNTMYVSRNTSNDVLVIDCSSDSILGSPISVGNNPTQMAYNVTNNTIYVSNSGSDNVSVINCVSNTVIATISLPSSPFLYEFPVGISFNSLTNSIYVGCHETSDTTNGSVLVIDCNTNIISENPFTVSGGYSPRSIVFNNYSNKIYTSNNAYGSDSLTVIVSTVNPYISGTTDYNQFVRELQNIPKRVRHIRLTTESYSQMAVPLYLQKRDANGIFCGVPRIPTEDLKPEDYQSFICELPFKPKELILNNNEIISQYTVAPNSTVGMVIYFDEIDMSDLLSEKLNVYNQIETKVEDLNTISEATLDRRYENRPTVKPSWLKNFKGGDAIKI